MRSAATEGFPVGLNEQDRIARPGRATADVARVDVRAPEAVDAHVVEEAVAQLVQICVHGSLILAEAHELPIHHRHDERVAARQEAEAAYAIVERESGELAAAIVEPHHTVGVDIGQPQRSVMPSGGFGENESRSQRLDRTELHAAHDCTPPASAQRAAPIRPRLSLPVWNQSSQARELEPWGGVVGS